MSYKELLESLEKDLKKFDISHKDLIRAFVESAYSSGVMAGIEQVEKIYKTYEK